MSLFRSEPPSKKSAFSRTKLLLGAGGLLLFIIGLKRSHRLEDGGTILAEDLLRRDEEGSAEDVTDHTERRGDPVS
jgi:hypothetical protein